MNPTSIYLGRQFGPVWAKTIVKIEIKPFFIKKRQVSKKKKKKKWPQKIGSRGNINVEVHVTMTLKCSQINFAKFGGLT